jgi:hypothetical protein
MTNMLNLVISLDYAQMMLFALFCGSLYGIGFYLIGMIVTWLMDIILKERD